MKILAQRPTHISAVATVPLITKTFTSNIMTEGYRQIQHQYKKSLKNNNINNTYIREERERERETARQTDRAGDRETDRQKDREGERERERGVYVGGDRVSKEGERKE